MTLPLRLGVGLLFLSLAACDADDASGDAALFEPDQDVTDGSLADAEPQDAALPDFPPAETLKLATYNLQTFYDGVDDPAVDEMEFTPGGSWSAADYQTRLSRAGKVLAELDADVLALCELESAEVLAQLAVAIQAAGGPVYTYRALGAGSQAARGLDVGLLSRYPIVGGGSRPINRQHTCQGPDGLMTLDGTRPEPRPILQADIDLDGDRVGDLVALVTHWKAKDTSSYPCLDTEDNHRRAALQIREVVDTLINANARRPVVVMGDFNSYEDEPAMTDDLGIELARGQLRQARDLYNTWGDASGVIQGNDTLQNSSYNYRGRWGRLDHILVTGNVRESGESDWRFVPGSVGSFHPRYLLDSSSRPIRYDVSDGTGYSDHLPVFMGLKR